MCEAEQHGVILIAPVSTREVMLTDKALLPDEDLRTRWDHADSRMRTGAHEKATLLRGDLKHYAPALRMEILGKAIRCVFDRHKGIDRLILVTSKQGEDTPEHFRKNDTHEMGLLVRDLLRLDPALRKVGDATKIMPVDGNPADYEVMRSFYQNSLPVWCAKLSADGVCYLEVTGGTPEMGSMLLLEGVRQFRARAAPLYIHENYEMPLTLDIGRQILVDGLRETLDRDLSVYAYHAAWETAKDHEAVLRESWGEPRYRALLALLDSTRRRLNFDFKQAKNALFGADRGLPPVFRRRFLAQAGELAPDRRTSQWLIAEVYHAAAVRLHTQAYDDFIGRVFRFQEAMLRDLCERLDVQFKGDHGEKLDLEWLAARPALHDALVRSGLDPGREVSRKMLLALAVRMAGDIGDSAALEHAKRLGRMEEVASLRNRLPIAHGFEGVSAEQLRDLYPPDGAEGLMAEMTALLRETAGEAATASPFERINALCHTLMEG